MPFYIKKIIFLSQILLIFKNFLKIFLRFIKSVIKDVVYKISYKKSNFFQVKKEKQRSKEELLFERNPISRRKH
jgi:hypothetical protein